LVDFHEIQQGGHAVQENLDVVTYNAVAPTIPKYAGVQTSEMDVKPEPVNVEL
jgi:hypothetical protein